MAKTSRNNETTAILAIAVVAIAFVVGLIVFGGGKSSSNSASGNLIPSDSYRSTTDMKKVTLVEFADYQCPACGLAYPDVKKVVDEHKDSVTYVFRNFPLSQHQNAGVAAEAAEAAGAQGKFWEMHDMLFQTQSAWSNSSNPIDIFVGYAGTLGLDVNKFRQEVTANAYKSKIDRDYADGEALKVNATPTFFINGTKYSGSFAYVDLTKAVNDAVANTK